MIVLCRCTADALRIRKTPNGEDTGKRIIRGQIVETWGRSWNDNWLYVRAPEGEGWSGSKYLEQLPPEIEAPAVVSLWPKVPNGLAEIRELFGAPHNPDAPRGSQHWNPDVLAGEVRIPDELVTELYRPPSWAPTQRVNRFSCHKLIEPVFLSVFTEIYRRGYWHLIEDFGGVHNYRAARNLQKISTHAWAIAIDLNVKQNPLGARPKMPPEIVGVFRDHGFKWGGPWGRPDGMHFQYATGY